MDYKTIGKRIKLARKEADLLQRQLGERLDLDQATISCYEKGTLAIEMETIHKLSRILGKPIAYFYGDEYSKTPNLISLGEVSIPVFTEIPTNFPEYANSDVKGYQKHPKHMYPSVDFALKKPINIANEPDDHADYYYFRIENEPASGKAMLYRMDSKYYLNRVTVKKNVLEIHSIKARTRIVKPQNTVFLAVLLFVAMESR